MQVRLSSFFESIKATLKEHNIIDALFGPMHQLALFMLLAVGGVAFVILRLLWKAVTSSAGDGSTGKPERLSEHGPSRVRR